VSRCPIMKSALITVISLAFVVSCATQVSPAAQMLMASAPDPRYWSSRVSCPECTTIFAALLEIGANSTIQQQILRHANATCDLLLDFWGGKVLYHACEKIGLDVVAKFLPFLWEELGSSKPGLAWDARAICSNFIPVCSNPCCSTTSRPEKVRLAFADANNFTRVAATWSTLEDTATHTVQWAPGANATIFPFSSTGSSRTYARQSAAARSGALASHFSQVQQGRMGGAGAHRCHGPAAWDNVQLPRGRQQRRLERRVHVHGATCRRWQRFSAAAAAAGCGHGLRPSQRPHGALPFIAFLRVSPRDLCCQLHCRLTAGLPGGCPAGGGRRWPR
jgi:hypothetical protein